MHTMNILNSIVEMGVVAICSLAVLGLLGLAILFDKDNTAF